MPLDQNPLFRKAMAPWHDTEKACYIVIVFMFLVLLFGIAGISAASEKTEYNDYIWVPVLLMVMSAGVIVSISIRLIKRYANQFSKHGHKVP
ncbi:MAG: hypothetical protein MUO43_01925 [Desulfobacterales bacterium]|nr:hypothetical protein [Desulfobacterales bacterium]